MFECFALLAPMASSSTMLSRFLCFGTYELKQRTSVVRHKALKDQLHEYAVSFWRLPPYNS